MELLLKMMDYFSSIENYESERKIYFDYTRKIMVYVYNSTQAMFYIFFIKCMVDVHIESLQDDIDYLIKENLSELIDCIFDCKNLDELADSHHRLINTSVDEIPHQKLIYMINDIFGNIINDSVTLSFCIPVAPHMWTQTINDHNQIIKNIESLIELDERFLFVRDLIMPNVIVEHKILHLPPVII